MKKRLAIIMLTALALSALCACGDGGGGSTADPKEQFVGKWVLATGESAYEFKADGTGTYTVSETPTEFTFEVNESKIKLTFKDAAEPSEYEFKIEGSTLTIQDPNGTALEYTKQ